MQLTKSTEENFRSSFKVCFFLLQETVKNLHSFLGLFFFVVVVIFTEEIAFKHFLFIDNITKFSYFALMKT